MTVAGLGKTLADLAAMRRPQPATGGSDRLVEVTPSGSNPGHLRMLTHVPAGLRPGAPLVVVLHGCTQNAASYDQGAGWSTLADRHGFAVLYAEQQRGNNSNLCFNWYQHADTARNEGEVLSIRQMVAQTVSAHGIDPARVYINGLSAGGAMTAAMLATYPELFAGGAIIAGLPYGAAEGVQQAFEAMFKVRHHSGAEWGNLVRAASPHRGPWPHVQIWHGTADATVKPGNAEELVKQWANVVGARSEPETNQVDGVAHRSFRGASGQVVLESYLVPGLGHGTPLDTASSDTDRGVGQAGPHMLEAGISSTWHIARSWGLLTQAARVRTEAGATAAKPAPAWPTGGSAIAARVNGVIEKALRTAGISTRPW